MTRAAGRHFLQIPDRPTFQTGIASDRFPTMDHRSPDFGLLGKEVLEGMKRVFKPPATW